MSFDKENLRVDASNDHMSDQDFQSLLDRIDEPLTQAEREQLDREQWERMAHSLDKLEQEAIEEAANSNVSTVVKASVLPRTELRTTTTTTHPKTAALASSSVAVSWSARSSRDQQEKDDLSNLLDDTETDASKPKGLTPTLPTIDTAPASELPCLTSTARPVSASAVVSFAVGIASAEFVNDFETP